MGKYRDPERARQNNVKKQRAFQERKKLKILSGEVVAEAAAIEAGELSDPQQSPPAGGGGGKMTRQQWANQKVSMGRALCGMAMSALKKVTDGKTSFVGPRDAAQLLRLGIDLVNANLAMSQPPKAGPEPGSILAEDKRFLADKLYMELSEALLERKSELQSLFDEADSE